jgi:ssDNA-binding Zn-finger/Zn-ribbon topoisomerase 1
MKKSVCECPTCSYKWQLRKENPKECPRCKRRLDSWGSKLKIETKQINNQAEKQKFEKELDKWNAEHPFP